MFITKRNGAKEEFSKEKIENAIKKAFNAVGEPYDEVIAENVIREFEYNNALHPDAFSVEDIQNSIEDALMEASYYDVAKAYIIYRHEHKKDRMAAQEAVDFIKNFVTSDNAANTTIDDNANVSTKGIGVLNAEIHKSANKNVNMYIWETEVHKLFPEISIKQMREDFNTILYAHDASSQILEPYCQADSMYPFLLNGLKDLGGKSAVPKNIDSFCGIYVNLVFALASEVKGAVATPEVLMYFDYFARKDWGDDYYLYPDEVITTKRCKRQKTIGSQIDQYFQQLTYSINQIAGSRGCQSPFTNFSFFDKYFFEGMFGEFQFPDGTKPTWESVNWVQKRYLHWLNQERLKEMLTYPVCSYACLIDDDGNYQDEETYEFICKEYSEGNSFFTYLSKSVDSLSSCCRLQNSVNDNTFNFTNGQMGIMTGSKQVITLNLNRIIQDWVRALPYYGDFITEDGHRTTLPKGYISKDSYKELKSYLISLLDRVYKYQIGWNTLLHWAKDNHLYKAYDAGFIDLDKQYLTIGINGLNQAAEFLGLQCNNNPEYREFCKLIFSTIKEQNALHKTEHEMYNCEQVPAESAAVKLYNRDKKDGYWIPSDTNLYASYIFKPNDKEISILDKITLHGDKFAAQELDGGVAAHLNLDAHLSYEQYKKLLKFAAQQGCKYFTFNVPNSECADCGYITKHPIDKCPKCGSEHIKLWDRIIGYLVCIDNWSKGRKIEQKTRVYSDGKGEIKC